MRAAIMEQEPRWQPRQVASETPQEGREGAHVSAPNETSGKGGGGLEHRRMMEACSICTREAPQGRPHARSRARPAGALSHLRDQTPGAKQGRHRGPEDLADPSGFLSVLSQGCPRELTNGAVKANTEARNSHRFLSVF